jgi:hypothetical protein
MQNKSATRVACRQLGKSVISSNLPNLRPIQQCLHPKQRPDYPLLIAHTSGEEESERGTPTNLKLFLLLRQGTARCFHCFLNLVVGRNMQ